MAIVTEKNTLKGYTVPKAFSASETLKGLQ
jgi:hypothetical protein